MAKFTDGSGVSRLWTRIQTLISNAISAIRFHGDAFYSTDGANLDSITQDCNSLTANGLYYYTSNGPSTVIGATTNDGSVFVQGYNDNWVSQIAQDYRTGNLFIRSRNSGTWTEWRAVPNSNDIPNVRTKMDINGRNSSDTVLFPESTFASGYNTSTNGIKDGVKESVIPYGFYYGSAVILNGEIHVLGGYANSVRRNHYKYSNGEWVSVSTLPYDFYDGCAVVLNDEIHILGSSLSGYTTKHYKYSNGEWVSVSTLPYDLYGGSAIVLNDEIHILGGSNNTTSYTKHYKYSNGEWVSVSTLPYNFYKGSAVVLNDEIHILGGGPSTNRKKHYKYSNGEWVSVSTLPYDFNGGSAVVLNDEIHILGSSIFDYRDLHYKYPKSAWINVSTLPYNFYYGSAVILNGEIHILGTSDTNIRGTTQGHYKLINSNTIPQIFNNYSHIEGYNTMAMADSSHAEGYSLSLGKLLTNQNATGSHVEGCNNSSSYSMYASGRGAHVEGYTQDDYARGNYASGDGAHSEGAATYASALASHAEGIGSSATALAAHAEGSSAATAQNAHAEGQSIASGSNAHSGGYNTEASLYCQFVHGNNNSGMCKFRGTSSGVINVSAGAAFGFGMNNTEYTTDTAVTNSKNGLNGTILNTATTTISLETQAMYLLFVSSYTISSGAIYGSAVYMITAHGKTDGTPNNLSVKVSSNAPATVAMAANNKITIKNGSTSRATQFQLMRIN